MGAAVVNSCGGMFNIRRLQSPLSNNMSGILVNLYVSTKYRQLRDMQNGVRAVASHLDLEGRWGLLWVTLTTI